MTEKQKVAVIVGGLALIIVLAWGVMPFTIGFGHGRQTCPGPIPALFMDLMVHPDFGVCVEFRAGYTGRQIAVGALAVLVLTGTAGAYFVLGTGGATPRSAPKLGGGDSG